MNRKNLFAAMLVMVLAASLSITACGKAKETESAPDEALTLEQYAVETHEVQKVVDEALSGSDVKIEIKGNDVIYTYELSSLEDYTEDVATNPDVIESQEKLLEKSAPLFGGIAKTLEEKSGISGIHTVVKYTYDGEVVVTRTFDSSDADSGNKTDEDSGEDSDEDGDGSDEESGETEGSAA